MLVVRRPLSVENFASMLLFCLQEPIAILNSSEPPPIMRFGQGNQTVQLNTELKDNKQPTTDNRRILN